MQYPTLAQLAKMSYADRIKRLRGIDKTSQDKLVNEAIVLASSILMANIEL